MNCPICKGPVRVTDFVETPTNEILKERKCYRCGKVFYSKETIVAGENSEFKEAWAFYHRVRPSHL